MSTSKRRIFTEDLNRLKPSLTCFLRWHSNLEKILQIHELQHTLLSHIDTSIPFNMKAVARCQCLSNSFTLELENLLPASIYNESPLTLISALRTLFSSQRDPDAFLAHAEGLRLQNYENVSSYIDTHSESRNLLLNANAAIKHQPNR